MLERRVDQTILPDPDERQQCNTAEQAIEELVAQRDHQGGQRLAPIIELPAMQPAPRSEEHTSELQSLMRISYAVFCLKKKTNITTQQPSRPHTTSTHLQK